VQGTALPGDRVGIELPDRDDPANVCLADVYGVGVDDRFWADSGRSVEWVLSDPTRHSSFSIAVIETLESGHRQRYVA